MIDDIFKYTRDKIAKETVGEQLFFDLVKIAGDGEWKNSAIKRHVSLLFHAARTARFNDYEEANRWARAVFALLDKLPKTEEMENLREAVITNRKFHERVYGMPCVACGADITGQTHHECDPKRANLRDAVMKQDRQDHGRSQTVGDRIAEGFRMLTEMEET